MSHMKFQALHAQKHDKDRTKFVVCSVVVELFKG